jgi:hypothetical protein
MITLPGEIVAAEACLVQVGTSRAHTEKELAAMVGCECHIQLDITALNVSGCNPRKKCGGNNQMASSSARERAHVHYHATGPASAARLLAS